MGNLSAILHLDFATFIGVKKNLAFFLCTRHNVAASRVISDIFSFLEFQWIVISINFQRRYLSHGPLTLLDIVNKLVRITRIFFNKSRIGFGRIWKD